MGLTDENYQQLKRLAFHYLGKQNASCTLNCTALVHEAFVKLASASAQINQDGHLIALTSLAMRQIIVDYARFKQAEKRGGDVIHFTLTDSVGAADGPDVGLLDLHTALKKLGSNSELLEKIVVLRFFAGLSVNKTAEALDRSPRSIERDWVRAKLYLFRELNLGSA